MSNRADDIDDLPPELRYLHYYKRWWYAVAALLVIAGGVLLVGRVSTESASMWIFWVGDVFQAAAVTLNLFLVVLTYNLFKTASQVTQQNERIHRISQLPILVAEIRPLSFDPYPSYEINVMNEGSGPALDVQIVFDYHAKSDVSSASKEREGSGARLAIGVINKASRSGMVAVDVRGIIALKPWHAFNTKHETTPTRAETKALLEPYVLVVRISYKDVYSQEGYTVYETHQASGDVGVELAELSAPPVEIGSDVKPIAFRRQPAADTPAAQSSAFPHR
jgi:hypothetical protein